MCIRIPTALLLLLVCGSASAAPEGVPERVRSIGRWARHDPATLWQGFEPWSPQDAARLLALYQNAFLHLDYNDAAPVGMRAAPPIAARVDELQALAANGNIGVRGRLCLSDRPDVMQRLPDLSPACSATRGASSSCDWEGAMDGRFGEAETVVKASGSATTGGPTLLSDAARAWTPALYRHRLAVLRPGAAGEERRRIIGNDPTSFSVDPPWNEPPAAGDRYEIRGSFDTNWVMRAPREVHEAALRRFWEDRRLCGDTPCRPAPFPLDPLHPGNPRGILDWLDGGAVRALATAEFVPALYGWGYDGGVDKPITQYSVLPHQWTEPHFRANAVVTDLRNPGYRAWRARHALYRLAEYGLGPGEGACLAVEMKPGLHAWYDEAAFGPSTTVCGAPNTHSWAGPAQICRDSQSFGGPLHPTQYGPGEFEAAASAYFRELVAVLAENGYADARILTVETPAFREVLWSTLDEQTRRLPQMQGVLWGVIEPSLSVLGATALGSPPTGIPAAEAPTAAAPPAESPPSWSIGGDSESPITQTGTSSWSDAPSASRRSAGGRGDMVSGKGSGGGGAAVEAPSLR